MKQSHVFGYAGGDTPPLQAYNNSPLNPNLSVSRQIIYKTKKARDWNSLRDENSSRYHPDYRHTPISHQAQLRHSHDNGASGATYCDFGSSVRERVVAIPPGWLAPSVNSLYLPKGDWFRHYFWNMKVLYYIIFPLSRVFWIFLIN